MKSPSREPLFTPAFVRFLTERCPRLRDAVAAVTWAGGDEALEAPLFERAATVLVYGEDPSVTSVGDRARGRILDYGPKLSLAVVAAEAVDTLDFDGLARDVALFDQRGCLSIHAIYTDGDAEALADDLAGALSRIAEALPPGRPTPREAIAAHQLRVDARMRGLYVAEVDPSCGTVVVDPGPELRPSPGRRSVRIHPLEDLRDLPGRLRGWRGRLQGAALAGEPARDLEPVLRELGISRCAEPGRLQTPDVRWQNGGRDLFEVL